MLMRKRESPKPLAIPEHALLVFYGRFTYQIFLPFNVNDNWLFDQPQIWLPIEYHLVIKEVPSENPLGAAEVNCMNIGSTEKQKGIEDSFALPLK